MTRVRTLRPVIVVLAAVVAILLSLAGCVSMPTGGPVQSYPVTQGTDAQSQQFMQFQPQSPGVGWKPQQIVQGFLAASASFGTYKDVAYQYLTPKDGKEWDPKWSAVVYKNEPAVGGPIYLPNPKQPKQPDEATVWVTGDIQANLKGSGSYSVRSGSSKGSGSYLFHLQTINGQWRISDAPQELLLTNESFLHDYQLTNLYFFDPSGSYLVPDPVYVPVGEKQQDLVTVLVDDLITQPNDWLLTGGATKTAFPAGTKRASVILSGATAVVNLKGAITKAGTAILDEVSAQLWSTLDGVGQGLPNVQQVKSVEIELNGTPWSSPNSPDNNPLVQSAGSYSPPSGLYKSNNKFYYVDSEGFLASAGANGKANQLALISTGYSQLAVSPDGGYVAVLRGTTLYAGIIGGKLADKGNHYTAISWAPNDYLWATTSTGIYTSYEGRGAMNGVQVGPTPPTDPQYTAIKIAPDGIRVAIIQNGNILIYGAISGLRTPNPKISLSTVQEDVASGQSFQSLAWYGPDDVITLANPGSTVTEYPVSGGPSTVIPADSNMQTIAAASTQQPIVASLKVGGSVQLVSYSNRTGSWTPVAADDPPAKGTPLTYPG